MGPSFAIIDPFCWYDHEIKDVESFPTAVSLCAFSSFLDVGKHPVEAATVSRSGSLIPRLDLGDHSPSPY